MNTVLYLVGQTDKYTPYCDFFDSMEIMNENDLRQFFKDEMESGHIHKENLDNHNITNEDDVFEMDISEIFGALCDNIDYDTNNGYYIKQQEVEINNEDMYD